MSKPENTKIDDSSLVVTVTVGQLNEVVERAVIKALNGNGHHVLLTAEQLATALQVNKATVYQWVKAKSIPYYQAGRFIRFNLQEVLETQRK